MRQNWKWFGHAGHLIVGSHCRFHLCTLVGDILVSTVGEYWPEEGSREIIARTRGVVLEDIGDARAADYMRKIGFEQIGFERKYETMAFHTTGRDCECGCGMPSIIPQEIEFEAYNDPVTATKGHLMICEVVERIDDVDVQRQKYDKKELDWWRSCVAPRFEPEQLPQIGSSTKGLRFRRV